jgi:hypothetical protein
VGKDVVPDHNDIGTSLPIRRLPAATRTTPAIVARQVNRFRHRTNACTKFAFGFRARSFSEKSGDAILSCLDRKGSTKSVFVNSGSRESR